MVARIHRTIQRGLYDLDNHSGVVTYLEADFMECEVKWALGSITMNKASGGDGIRVELFKIVKCNAFKLLHSIRCCSVSANLENSAVATGLEKSSDKECSNYYTIADISYASKVIFKIIQARLPQCVNQEFPHVQSGFQRGRGPRHQICNICWIMKKAWEFQKSICFCFIDYAKAFDCLDQKKLGKFFFFFLSFLGSIFFIYIYIFLFVVNFVIH